MELSIYLLPMTIINAEKANKLDSTFIQIINPQRLLSLVAFTNSDFSDGLKLTKITNCILQIRRMWTFSEVKIIFLGIIKHLQKHLKRVNKVDKPKIKDSSVRVLLLAMCRGKLSSVISWPMGKCPWSWCKW